MKIEDQVCSPGPAGRLQELGVKQNGVYSWAPTKIPGAYMLMGSGEFPAFTVAELGEMLPVGIYSAKVDAWHPQLCREWFCVYPPQLNYHFVTAATEADARAKMLIYLIEKGLVKP